MKGISREVACFVTTDCTGRTSIDVLLSGHHLTHCGNRESVMDVEWYLFILTCKKEKRTCGGIEERNGCVSLFFTFLFVAKNTHRTSIVISTTAELFFFPFAFGLKGATY